MWQVRLLNYATLNLNLNLFNMFVLTEQGMLPVPANCMSLYPAKISSRLSQWKRSTFQDFTVCACHIASFSVWLGSIKGMSDD